MSNTDEEANKRMNKIEELQKSLSPYDFAISVKTAANDNKKFYHLKSGDYVRVKKSFAQNGGSIVNEGETFYFANSGFTPYYGGYTVFVSKDKNELYSIAFQEKEEREILDHLEDYLEVIEPNKEPIKIIDLSKNIEEVENDDAATEFAVKLGIGVIEELMGKPMAEIISDLENEEQENNLDESITQENDNEIPEFEIEDGVLKKYNGCATEVVVPDTVREITSNAFSNCESLVKLDIPSSVEKTGNYFCQDCCNLEEITIPLKKDVLRWIDFSNCEKLHSMSIAEGITEIEENAFSMFNKIAVITIPNGVTKIGKNAFSGLKKLTTVNLPDSVITIDSHAFNNCSNLKSIKLSDGITRIEKNTFAKCTSLIDISIPQGVTAIGDNAFQNCSRLTKVVLPTGLCEIGVSAFDGCESLTELSIPESVTTIGSFAFSGCSSLEKVTKPYTINIEVFEDTPYYENAKKST